jgi:hypothetical protein
MIGRATIRAVMHRQGGLVATALRPTGTSNVTLVILAAVLTLTGCGHVNDPAAIVPSSVPMSPEIGNASALVDPAGAGNHPMPPDPRFAETARSVCFGHGDFREAPDVHLVVQDQRTDREALLVFAQGNEAISCLVGRSPSGGLEVLTEASDTAFVEGVDLAVTSWTAHDRGGILVGRFRLPVASIRIRLRDGRLVEASMGNGYFAAWWDAGTEPIFVSGYDASGNRIATDDLKELSIGPP